MRLFVALPVADDVREALAASVARWRAHAGAGQARGWRWTRPEGWHVTVAFLGDVGEHRVGAVGEVVGTAVAGAGRIELRLDTVERFGRNVLHVRVVDEPPGAVAVLGTVVQQALRGADLPVQTREVRPHLTLARAGRRGVAAPGEMTVPQLGWWVSAVGLYRSHLGDGPARYELLERFELR